MTDINGLAYYEVDFNADGTLNTATGGGDGGLPAAVAKGGITDLFVLSHGWNNGVDSARDLYQAMFALLADQLGDAVVQQRGRRGDLAVSAVPGRRSGQRTSRCRPPARSWPPR